MTLNDVRVIAKRKAESMYGNVHWTEIGRRMDMELVLFKKAGLLDAIEKALKAKEKGELFLSRLCLGNSLLLYFLGLTNVNPLPRHNYCPKCHKFHWGSKETKCCSYCGTPLIEDGYGLDEEIVIQDVLVKNLKLQLSTCVSDYEDDKLRFWPVKELKLAKLLGLTQEDLDKVPKNIKEIIACFNPSHYLFYKKKDYLDHNAFVDIGDLGTSIFQKTALERNAKTFDDLVTVGCMIHGTGVLSGNEEFDTGIYSRDDLFKFLKENQLDDTDSYRISLETRLCGKGHLSALSEFKLKEAGVEDKYIDYLRQLDYLFHKAHVISHLKLYLNLASIYLKDPMRYYKAYFELTMPNDKEMGKDFVKSVVKSKKTQFENFYYSLVDFKERCADYYNWEPQDLIFHFEVPDDD